MTVLIYIALAVFGLILGSFANALVWRLHAQDEIQDQIDELQQAISAGLSDKRRDKKVAELRTKLQPLSMSRGRSMCSNCHHPLAPIDLIPLFSYLYLGGKCRYCHKPIQDTPWLEALLPVAFVASYLLWPLQLSGYGLLAFVFWLAFLTAFAALTVYDIRWYLLPDRVVWPLVGLAAVQVLLHATVYGGGAAVLVSALWGIVTASGIFWALYRVSNGEWIGGGDVKLGLVLGMLVGGPLPGLMLIFIASLLGTLASLPMYIQHRLKRGAVIPFGPFLMIAAAILVLYSTQLQDWLNRLVGGGL